MFFAIKPVLVVFTFLLSVSAYAADAAPVDLGKKATVQFVRSSGTLAVVKARVEVNGRRLTDLAKGASNEILVDPGRTIVKIDTAYSPGQTVFSFSAEEGVEYRFDVVDSIDKVDADHLFGVPPKAPNGEVVESGGVLKAFLFSVKSTKPAKLDPPAVVPAAKPADPVTPVIPPPADKPIPAANAAAEKSSRTAQEQLQELKKLYEQELISKELYLEKQKKILDGM